jgi:hypothetical protein
MWIFSPPDAFCSAMSSIVHTCKHNAPMSMQETRGNTMHAWQHDAVASLPAVYRAWPVCAGCVARLVYGVCCMAGVRTAVSALDGAASLLLKCCAWCARARQNNG